MNDCIQKYLASGGTLCPFCGSEEIFRCTLEFEGENIRQYQDCIVCGCEWRAYYNLVGVHIDGEYYKREG